MFQSNCSFDANRKGSVDLISQDSFHKVDGLDLVNTLWYISSISPWPDKDTRIVQSIPSGDTHTSNVGKQEYQVK